MPKNTVPWSFAACLFVAAAEAQVPVNIIYFEELSAVPPAASAVGVGKPALAAPRQWTFDAFGRRFDIALEPNARLTKLTQDLRLDAGIAAYRGTLAQGGDSWVRVVTTPEGPSGLIWDGTTLYGIEHRNDSAAATGRAVIFRLDDVVVAPGTMECAIADAPLSAGQAYASLLEEMTTMAAQGATMNLDIGAVADFEFNQSFGTGSSAALLTRFNNIDGIFSDQLGIQITVAEIEVFTTNTDPFTSTDAQALLEEVAIYRGDTSAQDAQGLTHLFTGRDLDGTTAGIAYLGVVCSTKNPLDPLGRSFGAGLSEGRRGAVLDSLVAAHEIGHNFGAPHDGEAGTACANTPTTFLMAPSINGIDQFSACSVSEMQPEIASASCMTAIGDPDLRLTAAASAPTLQAGVASDYVLDLGNIGVETATSVTVDATLGSGLELLGASASSGACTTGTDTVSCALGDVAGGAARTVTVTLRSSVPGQHTLSAAAATTAQDDDPSNDQIDDVVTVVPVVDLVLSGAAQAVVVQQSARVDVSLANDSDFAASAVSLSAAFSSALRVDSATLGGQSCTVSATAATCSLANLAARTNAVLSLDLTGLVTGTEQVTIDASAAESEGNAANNSLSLSVDVADPPATPESSSGGGGAASLWWLLLGGGLLGWRSRPHSDRKRKTR